MSDANETLVNISSFVNETLVNTNSFVNSDIYVYSVVVSYAMYSIFGVIFNLGTAVVIVVYRRPLSTHHILVLQMLATNTATSAICLPVYVYTLNSRRPALSDEFCVFDGFFRYFTTCQYLMTLLLICLHRYFSVVYPGSKWLTFGGTKKTVFIMMSTSAFVFIVLFQAVFSVWGGYGYREKLGVCSILTNAEGGTNSFLLFGFSTATVLPLSAIIICYSHICHVLRKQNAALVAAANQDPASQRTLRAKKSRQRHDTSVTITVIIISFLYVVCNVPLALGVVVKVLDSDVYFKTFASAIFMVHVVSDPLIYAIRERKIRENMVSCLESLNRQQKKGPSKPSNDYSLASQSQL